MVGQTYKYTITNSGTLIAAGSNQSFDESGNIVKSPPNSNFDTFDFRTKTGLNTQGVESNIAPISNAQILSAPQVSTGSAEVSQWRQKLQELEEKKSNYVNSGRWGAAEANAYKAQKSMLEGKQAQYEKRVALASGELVEYKGHATPVELAQQGITLSASERSSMYGVSQQAEKPEFTVLPQETFTTKTINVPAGMNAGEIINLGRQENLGWEDLAKVAEITTRTEKPIFAGLNQPTTGPTFTSVNTALGQSTAEFKPVTNEYGLLKGYEDISAKQTINIATKEARQAAAEPFQFNVEDANKNFTADLAAGAIQAPKDYVVPQQTFSDQLGGLNKAGAEMLYGEKGVAKLEGAESWLGGLQSAAYKTDLNIPGSAGAALGLGAGIWAVEQVKNPVSTAASLGLSFGGGLALGGGIKAFEGLAAGGKVAQAVYKVGKPVGGSALALATGWYAGTKGAQLVLAPSMTQKGEVLAQTGAELGSFMGGAFVGAKAVGALQLKGLSSKYTAQYKDLVSPDFSKDLALAAKSKELDINLRVTPIKGAVAAKEVYAFGEQKGMLGVKEPILGKATTMTYQELLKQPKDFVVKYSYSQERFGASEGGVAFRPAKTEPITYDFTQPESLSKELAQILPAEASLKSSVKQDFWNVVSAESIAKSVEPQFEMGLTHYAGKPYYERSFLKAEVQGGIDLSASTDLAVLRGKGRAGKAGRPKDFFGAERISKESFSLPKDELYPVELQRGQDMVRFDVNKFGDVRGPLKIEKVEFAFKKPSAEMKGFGFKTDFKGMGFSKSSQGFQPQKRKSSEARQNFGITGTGTILMSPEFFSRKSFVMPDLGKVSQPFRAIAGAGSLGKSSLAMGGLSEKLLRGKRRPSYVYDPLSEQVVYPGAVSPGANKGVAEFFRGRKGVSSAGFLGGRRARQEKGWVTSDATKLANLGMAQGAGLNVLQGMQQELGQGLKQFSQQTEVSKGKTEKLNVLGLQDLQVQVPQSIQVSKQSQKQVQQQIVKQDIVSWQDLFGGGKPGPSKPEKPGWPVVPIVLPKGFGGKKGFGRNVFGKQLKRYQPSFAAIGLGIKQQFGKGFKEFSSGLGIRPIPLMKNPFAKARKVRKSKRKKK